MLTDRPSHPGAAATDAASPRKPRVLVLLATYNGEPWLDAQLSSLAAQADVELAVLASDHGSTDGTLAVLERRRARGLNLRVLPGTAPGRGSAANFFHLLRQHDPHSADFVALCDQDDVWYPQRLRRAVEVLRREGAAAYSSDVLAVWPDGRRIQVRKSQAQRRYDHLLEPAGPGCTYVLRADFARTMREELSRDPERFAPIRQHDWVLYMYARSHGIPWVIDAFEGLEYRQHEDNEVGANVGLAGMRRRWDRATSGRFRQEVSHVGRLWPGDHEPMLRRFERFSLLDQAVIALKARSLRRRPKDQLALFAMIFWRVLR